MSTTATNNLSSYTDTGGLAKLRGQAKNPSEETLRKVAAQFESMFIQMMLKSARDAKLTDEGLFDNHESELYRDMFDKQVSINMAEHGGIGIGDMLVRQLRQSGMPNMSDPALDAAAIPRSNVASNKLANVATETENLSSNAHPHWQVAGPQEFVQQVLPHAQRAAAKLGIRPDALIAQAALETGWGSAMPRHPDGRPSFNLFGIKADSAWSGARVVNQTLEFKPESGLTRQSASFRSYASVEEAFDDYAQFIKNQPRYSKALAVAGDEASYMQALQDAGYATDPNYAQKVLRVMDRATELAHPLLASSGTTGLSRAQLE